jgi:hypothetical protein
MKKYRIYAVYDTYCVVEIEAEDAEDAYDIAEGMDGGNFTCTDTGDWRIFDVREIQA